MEIRKPAENRYEAMDYRRCGASGLKLPLISLGLWWNFGEQDPFVNCRDLIWRAFDLGVSHIDLANNYGPPPGAAEETLGRVLNQDLGAYRDELVISTKAGHLMWPGPYGDWGSRKYLIASLDQSLQRMGLDYVDIFYSHRPDPNTPIEETMGALDSIVRQGKALYVGISQYDTPQSQRAIDVLRELGTPCLIHQKSYSMLAREAEDSLLETLDHNGVGCIAFSVLRQGMLTDKYLDGVPKGSRADKSWTNLTRERIAPDVIEKVRRLNDIAKKRDQTMAQMAVSWVLRDERVTSALVGVSRVEQLEENIAASKQAEFSAEEIKSIDEILADPS